MFLFVFLTLVSSQFVFFLRGGFGSFGVFLLILGLNSMVFFFKSSFSDFMYCEMNPLRNLLRCWRLPGTNMEVDNPPVCRGTCSASMLVPGSVRSSRLGQRLGEGLLRLNWSRWPRFVNPGGFLGAGPVLLIM